MIYFCTQTHNSGNAPLKRGQTHTTSDRTVVKPINYAEEGMASEKVNPAMTLPALLTEAAARQGCKNSNCLSSPSVASLRVLFSQRFPCLSC